MSSAPAEGLPAYEWPPLPLLDPDQAAIILAERLQAAWDDLEEQRLRLLAAAVIAGRAPVVRPYFAEFENAIRLFKERVMGDVVIFLVVHLGPTYEAGMIAANPGLAPDLEGITVPTPEELAAGAVPPETPAGLSVNFDQAHQTALTSLCVDTYEDFLQRAEEAGRVSAEFARAVRTAAALELPKLAAGGRTAKDAAKRLEDRLVADYGIRHITYRNGRRVSVRHYARMVARTKSAVAYNAGTLNELHALGVGYVEVFDGPECGWLDHADKDRANRSIRTVLEAAARPIAHPNCRRAFGGRPDVTTAEEVAAAETLQGGGSPAPLPVVPEDPPTSIRPAQMRRARLQAQRAARRAGTGATLDEQVETTVRRAVDSAAGFRDVGGGWSVGPRGDRWSARNPQGGERFFDTAEEALAYARR